MRRSNSLLKNLARNQQAAGGVAQPSFPQMPAYPADPQGYAAAPAYPQHLSPQPHPVAYPPAPAALDQPQAFPQPERGSADLRQARDSLETLIGRLNTLATTQENQKAGAARDNLTGQVQGLAHTLAQIQSEITALRSQAPGQPDHELRTMIRTLSEEMRASQGQRLDTDAFARVVETGHAAVLEEIRAIQSSVAGSPTDFDAFSKVLEVGHNDLAARIEGLATVVSGIAERNNANENFAIVDQLMRLEQMVSRSMADGGEAAGLTSQVNDRLDEVTAAILAMSGNNQALDNMERVEARITELSKNLEAQATSMESLGAFAPEKLDELATEIRTAISGIDARLEAMPHMEADQRELISGIVALDEKLSGLVGDGTDRGTLEQLVSSIAVLDEKLSGMPDVDRATDASRDLLSGIQEVSERLANLSAVVQGVDEKAAGDGSALLERLDELVGQVNRMQAENHDPDPMQDRFVALEEQLMAISGRLEAGAGSSSSPGEGIAGADQCAEILQRIEHLSQRMDSFTASGDSADIGPAVASLEQQMQNIANRLDEGGDAQGAVAPLFERMDSLEQQLGASRDIGIDLAAGAAEEAVRRVMTETAAAGAGIDRELVESLQHEIQQLTRNTARNDSLSDEVLTELQQSMTNISGRLEALEAGLGTMRPAPLVQPAPPEPGPYEQEVEAPDYAAMPSETQAEALAQAAAAHDTTDHDLENMQADLSPEAVETPVQAPQQTPVSPEEFDRQEETLQSYEPEAPQPEKKMSAGEFLVRAARQAERERDIAKRESEQEFQHAHHAASRDEFDLQSSGPATTTGAGENPMTDAAVQPVPTQSGLAAEVPDVATPVEQPQPEDTTYAAETPAREDIPLEPGARGPDLASLVRQANERRKALSERGEEPGGTDFLAAARRAAQAAAMEASEAEKENQEPARSGGILGALPDLLGRRKKAVAIGASALLLAAVAAPVISGLGTNSDRDWTETAMMQFAGQGEQGTGELPTVETLQEPRLSDVPGAEAGIDEALVAGATGDDFATGSIEAVETGAEVVPAAHTPATGQAVTKIEPVYDEDQLAFASADLREAALRNDPLALFEVARRKTKGIGTKKDLPGAARGYEVAASKGLVPAQYIIGNLHEKGIGVSPDRTIAQAWYEQAADNGHAVAMHNLGVLHASPDPRTGKSDLPEAFKWFVKAADHGIRDSQVNLGIFHAKGSAGTVDLVESYKWFAIASSAGDKDAASKRDLIANAMRPDQIAEAKKRVQAWRQIVPDEEANKVLIPETWKEASEKIAVLTDTASIAQAQALLGKIGFDAGPADGVMGSKTRQAILDFRSRVGLPTDERIDSELMEALRAIAI